MNVHAVITLEIYLTNLITYGSAYHIVTNPGSPLQTSAIPEYEPENIVNTGLMC
jgi:hypothetical protein